MKKSLPVIIGLCFIPGGKLIILAWVGKDLWELAVKLKFSPIGWLVRKNRHKKALMR